MNLSAAFGVKSVRFSHLHIRLWNNKKNPNDAGGYLIPLARKTTFCAYSSLKIVIIINNHKMKGKKQVVLLVPSLLARSRNWVKCSFTGPFWLRRGLSHLARWAGFHPLTTVIVWIKSCQERFTQMAREGERDKETQRGRERGGWIRWDDFSSRLFQTHMLNTSPVGRCGPSDTLVAPRGCKHTSWVWI